MTGYSMSYIDASGERATVGFASGPSPREIARAARGAARALERAFAAHAGDVDVDGLRVERIAPDGSGALPIPVDTRIGDLPDALAGALAPSAEPAGADPAPGAPAPGELPQTELLRRAWLASAALGHDPDEDALAAYDALMGELERRSASVDTRLGTLVAEVVEPDAGYGGIQVSLIKPDGTGGLVSWTEVGPEDEYGPTAQTFSYDGVDEEPVMTVCDPDGEWMRDDLASLVRAPVAPAGRDGAIAACIVNRRAVEEGLRALGVEGPTPEMVGRVGAFMEDGLLEELEGRAASLIEDAAAAVLPDIAPADVALRAAGAQMVATEEIDGLIALGRERWSAREFPDLLAATTPDEVIVADNSTGEMFVTGFSDVRAACEWLRGGDCTDAEAVARAERARESVERRDRTRRKL